MAGLFRVPNGMSPLEWLAKLFGGKSAAAEGKYSIPVGNRLINIDNVSGHGATPNHQNINYRGATVLLSPDEFRQLALPLGAETNPFIKEAMSNGEGVAGPQLYSNMPSLGFSPSGAPKTSPGEIMGHEGRNRMQEIGKVDPSIPIPVQIFPGGGFRSRDLTPENLRQLFERIRAETGTLQSYPRRGAAQIGDNFVEYRQGGLAALK